VDGNTIEDILDEHSESGGGTLLKTIAEEALEIEYASRVDLGVELTETFLDVMNVIYATNGFIETLVETLSGFQEVDSTLVLIEKQPDTNHATNKIFETIFGYFCNPRYKNALVEEPKIKTGTLVSPPSPDKAAECSRNPLGLVAVIPLEGYAKNGITLYKEELERQGSAKNNYRQNKHDTKAIFTQYCANTGLVLPRGSKVDDIADSFCMTIFAVGKLLAYAQ
jgi:hypothetical protein